MQSLRTSLWANTTLILEANRYDSTPISLSLAIAELVEVDETLKQMIHDGASEKMMNDYAFQNNPSIQESIKLNLENGITSIGEIVRLQNISDA